MAVKILKVGGSVVTHKDADSSLNHAQIDAVRQDVARWLAESPHHRLIFVSGAGSYGHPLAKRYAIHAPTPDKDALGFLRTTTNMQRMGAELAHIFQEHDLPFFPIAPSSVFSTDDGRIAASYLAPIEQALARGLVPFLWGDAVFDARHTFRILSGDQINTYLCEHMAIDALLYGTDVDGVFWDDPKRNPAAQPIPRIDDGNYARVLAALSDSRHVDVTQGMRGKIEEIHATRRRPLTCVVYNALVPGNTYRALAGEPVGTTLAFTQAAAHTPGADA